MGVLRKIISIFIILGVIFSMSGCADNQKVIVDTKGMTKLQEAVVVTAESYYLRGNYAQYDMGSLYKNATGSMERRLTGVKAPEDYTAQQTGYTDCSGFAYDVYLKALGIKLCDSSPWTKTYCESLDNTILREYPTENMTENEKQQKIKEFTEALEPGDMIVYRYKGNMSGHVMLYVGNGMMIHSGGASFNYEEGHEVYEEKGTYRYEPIADSLFVEGHRRYLFDKHVYVIVRPLDSFGGAIPEATLSRMNEMRGIKAEKISSHTYGQTVNENEEVTFTFVLENYSDKAKNLEIFDTVPENTTYLSGADKVDGNNLSWKVKVEPKEIKKISYTVKVNDNSLGKYIVSSSFVNSVAVNCAEILVANTLSATEQEEISKAVSNMKESELNGLLLVNEIYQKPIFSDKTNVQFWNDIVDVWSDTLGEGLELSNMVVPRLYGGRNVREFDKTSEQAKLRTHRVTADLLVTGDIIAADEMLYIFSDGSLYDLGTKEKADITVLENILAAQRFVVLRPSLMF